jgi:K+-transporting ATPase c subunit
VGKRVKYAYCTPRTQVEEKDTVNQSLATANERIEELNKHLIDRIQKLVESFRSSNQQQSQFLIVESLTLSLQLINYGLLKSSLESQEQCQLLADMAMANGQLAETNKMLTEAVKAIQKQLKEHQHVVL